MTSDTNWEHNIRWEKHGHQLLLEHEVLLASPKNKFFLEVGSDRGEGSTKILAELAKRLQLIFITIDMDSNICEKAMKTVGAVNPRFSAECGLGENFIPLFEDESIAILYLDAYDTMPVGFDLPQDIKDPYIKNMGKWNNEDAWNMHLKCSIAADKKLIPGGFICFDDMWRKDGIWATRSKGYLAVPWLMEHGYEEISYVDGCVLLGKPS
jgi:hypothetical protein